MIVKKIRSKKSLLDHFEGKLNVLLLFVFEDSVPIVL